MNEKTKLWYLQNFNLFKKLNDSTMNQLSKKSKMQENKKREIIYFPEEPSKTIYLLKEGMVKISRVSEDGRSTILGLIGPGDIFGESAILGQSKRENFAEVVEDAVICTINKEMFQELLTNNPELSLRITKFIGFRRREIEAHIEDIVFKDARERVVAFLNRYIKNFGKKLLDGMIVRPFLTHQEIAELTATTRQTVNSILNDLVREEKIKYTRRYLKIFSEIV
tara:strand:- start:400 stop:1071 length:672 start_codon:yes stop_codon:yes gene_type:complete